MIADEDDEEEAGACAETVRCFRRDCNCTRGALIVSVAGAVVDACVSTWPSISENKKVKSLSAI
jgi:hypothetical protein